MLERPDIADAEIAACLAESYGVAGAAVEFLPYGNDPNSWVFRASGAEGERYFLKLKKPPVYEPALVVPRYLRDQGIEQVLAPLPARSGRFWATAGRFALIAYPYIDGQPVYEAGMPEARWVEFGAALRRVHAARLPPGLLALVDRETFQPTWTPVMERSQAKIDSGALEGPFQRALAEFWRSRQPALARLLARASRLGGQLQARPPAFVLCHTDIHTYNLLVDGESRITIIDWDYPQMAPKERDLRYILGALPGTSEEAARREALFFQGYGPPAVDPLSLAYYRVELAIQDLGDLAERILFSPDLGEISKQDALEGFMFIFADGQVERALGEDLSLRPD